MAAAFLQGSRPADILEERHRRARVYSRRYREAHAEEIREKRAAAYDPAKRRAAYLTHWRRENDAARRWGQENRERFLATRTAYTARKKAEAQAAGAANCGAHKLAASVF